MAFTLYSLLQAALLCVNAIAVLHEERFLKNNLMQCLSQSQLTFCRNCFPEVKFSSVFSRFLQLAGEQTRELVDSERSQELNLS
ncbi:immediate early response 3-interacting protein 1 isoform X1 [Canis lupus baileyi]|uniref:immediate early response 3-interacting protein 1 n=1 Tax=Canis lupus familiaris TaxID=9615 RepID=UPI000BAA1B3E|nr:immediate early response 3-interacting protein 1 [Canis lupus familiaris]XP_025284769.1 immediate early response 3-interacting protein 1 isoform X1 [Canis lupus dingo]XP_038399287.1 immediate early response 3-interacting protein 1 [Canis lupus familiaris]XP_038528093.1 immediate early response 3-interacting protein 1 [Canis lupus familiaris]|eukprot:XP_022277133.1 immediate early response 3-interacting protein 1 isoform X1 [Canis lupus familiaris]